MWHVFLFAALPRRRKLARAVSSAGRAPASADAVDMLVRRRTRSREASTSESRTGISAVYGLFLPSQQSGATPRDRAPAGGPAQAICKVGIDRMFRPPGTYIHDFQVS